MRTTVIDQDAKLVGQPGLMVTYACRFTAVQGTSVCNLCEIPTLLFVNSCSIYVDYFSLSRYLELLFSK
jgi:hypothetical protein